MAHKKTVKKDVKQEVKKQIKAPLSQTEGQFFQELVNSSNAYAALLKQRDQYDYVIKRLQADRKKIQTGEIKLPVIMTIIPKVMSYMEDDKKKVLKLIDDQITTYTSMVKGLQGQIELRQEQFIESGVRNREFLASRFKEAKAKQIVPLRDVAKKDEETLFEADFKELLESESKKEEFHKAQKEAVKRNVARKKKQSKK